MFDVATNNSAAAAAAADSIMSTVDDRAMISILLPPQWWKQLINNCWRRVRTSKYIKNWFLSTRHQQMVQSKMKLKWNEKDQQRYSVAS